MPRLQGLRAAVMVTACFIAGAGHAQAQSYPTKPIRMMIGFASGGATDVIARILSPRPTAYLGQQIIIENRPGADALLAMEQVVFSSTPGSRKKQGLSLSRSGKSGASWRSRLI